MKTDNIIKTALIAAGVLLFISCDKYLGELPDNRTEIDTPEKIMNLLVAAYPDIAPYGIWEMMSDNITDWGKAVDEGNAVMRDTYRFRNIESTSYDSPHWIWEGTYKAIGVANVALKEALASQDFSKVKAQTGEAYLCRAFSHFLLCNLFGQAYDPINSSTDLGIPYVTEPEDIVFVPYERNTVAEVYEKIAADIEAGFPLLDDSIYKVPLYHFTKRAAAAFATQFYLYYGKYEKAIEYADYVIGNDPKALYRDWSLVTGTNTNEIANFYIAGTEPANIFCHGFTSLYMRYRGARYVHTSALTNETSASVGPWGAKLDPYSQTWMFGNYRHYAMPKIREYFLVTDPVANVGEPFIVKVAYSTEKALIDRAEAYTMLGKYAEAAQDLCSFYESSKAGYLPSVDEIISFYNDLPYSTLDKPTVKKRMESKFLELYDENKDGKMENMLHACLHARRIVTLEEGDRTLDLKRHGIAYTHVLDGEEDIEISVRDPRLAIQIPDMAVMAGVTPNPR